MVIRIRKFRKSDANAASKMLLVAFEWFHGRKKKSWLWKSLQPSSILENSQSQNILVAVDEGGEVVGYISSSTASYGAAYVPTVGVHPRAQSSGVGTALLERKLKDLRKRGVRKVWLLVNRANVRAIGFYLKRGFVIEGYLRDHTGPGSDEVLFSKFL